MSTISHKVEGQIVSFAGDLNESGTVEYFEQTISPLLKGGTVRLDFSHVPRSNSTGIKYFFRYLNETKPDVLFVRVPFWLLEQFCMVKGLLDDGRKVHSLLLPFYSESTEKEVVQEVVFDKDIPVLDDYSDYKLDPLIIDGEEYHAEFHVPTLFETLVGKLK